MAILTKNTDFEKLWGEVVPTIAFDSDTYTLEGTEGGDITCPFAVYNDDSGYVITDDCTFEFSDDNISVDDGNFVVADDVAAGEYTTTVTATYIYKSATVTTTATIVITVESASADYAQQYLTFEALENSVFMLTVPAPITSDYMSSISYSTDDGENWVTTNIDDTDQTITTPTVTTGNKVLWKGEGVTTCVINSWVPRKCQFSATGQYNVSGNIMSLFSEDYAQQVEFARESNHNTAYLFSGDIKIKNAEHLILPATSLTTECYSQMFKGCSGLTAAPALPATTLTSSCYSQMFNGCTSLTVAPALPATTLAQTCYSQMFNGCTSLTAAPALPATTLTEMCYLGMFKGCSGLTSAPALPATTLTSSCYSQMFNGCTSLTVAPALPATTLAQTCYAQMFNGCTSLTAAPALPATTLAQACYSQMFNGCTSLTAAPALPATTLVTECYTLMFAGCENLDYIKAMYTTTPSYSYTGNWVSGVAATGTFVKNESAEWDDTGFDGIPTGWTVETATE